MRHISQLSAIMTPENQVISNLLAVPHHRPFSERSKARNKGCQSMKLTTHLHFVLGLSITYSMIL